MTQTEFKVELNKIFKTQDLLNISPAIYLHPDHIEYYENFHKSMITEDYQWCYDYLIKNRALFEGRDYEALVYKMKVVQDK
jgi:hypothetical protein